MKAIVVIAVYRVTVFDHVIFKNQVISQSAQTVAGKILHQIAADQGGVAAHGNAEIHIPAGVIDNGHAIPRHLNGVAGQGIPVIGAPGRRVGNRVKLTVVDDHSAAVDRILADGRIGESYNIGTGEERSVEQVTDIILSTLGKPESLKMYVPDRPGHDARYALNSSKLRNELGWAPMHTADAGIAATVEWYRDNPEWWQRVKSGAYQEYYDAYYRAELGANV